ncbi:MAG: ketoacyl-ACP synthase III, partial [Imperialibacter sp.]
TIKNLEYTEHFSAEEAAEIVEKTGIVERRFAEPGTCASDLCQAAAERLIEGMGINKEEIDLLVFVSQTPDYRMPATSVLLQERLGLSKQTMAFDINLGCSAFVYGMSVVYALMQQQGMRKALLLDGETRSRVYSAKDRKVAYLFGDGGVAALIERDERFGQSFFSLNSDGSRENLIKADAGGYRNPSSAKTVKERVVDDNGNIRTAEQGYMNGPDVFNFVIREIPQDLKRLSEFAQTNMSTLDYYVFHQANSYMNNYLGKKLKLDPEKVPVCLHRFGNTSSVSIPLTIATELHGKLKERRKILLSSFGVGMSWASAIITMENCYTTDLVEI